MYIVKAKFLLIVSTLLIVLFISLSNVYALEINLTYDPTEPGGVDPCEIEVTTCSGGEDKTPQLTAIVEAVAGYYESIIKDDLEVDMTYYWLDPALGAPDALVLERNLDGKIIRSRIRISSNLNYFYDSSPSSDMEFNMRPKLLRTLRADEFTEAFMGEAQEFYEIAYNGRESSPQSLDLVTVVFHEMGHALGVSNDVNTACDQDNDPYYHLDPDFDGVSEFDAKAFEFVTFDEDLMMDVIQFDCAHLAIGGINSCKPEGQEDQTVGEIFDEPSTVEGLTVGQCAAHQSLFWQGPYPQSRAKPSINDILVMQQGGNWENIDLPRIYSSESGDWSDNATWFSNQVPNEYDDVFIVNQLPLFEITEIEVDTDRFAKSIYISDENHLAITENKLHVLGPVTIAGPNSTTGPLRPIIEPNGEPPIGIEGPFSTVFVEPGGNLTAFELTVEDGARFEIESSGQANIGKTFNDGVIRGHGTFNTWLLENTRIIFADGNLTIAIPETDPDDTLGIGNPVLDLDGSSFWGDPLARIDATEGNLVFDGEIDAYVKAAILVGAGRSIHFTQGWSQGQAALNVPQHKLVLEGGVTGATIIGNSTLQGKVEVNGIGVFSSPVVFSSSPFVDLNIGGLTPGLEHDQLQFEQHVTFAGTLSLSFVDGYSPGFQDTIVLATYPDHTNEFVTVTGVDLNLGLEGGLKLFLQYQATQLSLYVGLDGGDPGQANCNGQTVAQQAAIHGGMNNAAAFHGFNSVKAFQDAIQGFCE